MGSLELPQGRSTGARSKGRWVGKERRRGQASWQADAGALVTACLQWVEQNYGSALDVSGCLELGPDNG